MTAVETSVNGRPVFLFRPDWSRPADTGIDLLATAARARETGGSVCMLPGSNQRLKISMDHAVTAEGPQAAWWSMVWRAASAAREVRTWWRDTMTSAAHEWRRELRRQASNGQLPFDVRLRLREIADASAVRRDPYRFPRRLLLAPSTLSLPAPLREQTRMELKARGLTDCTRLVTFESRARPDIVRAALDFLRREGYTIVRIGDRGEQMRSGDGVLDLRAVHPRPALFEMSLVAASTFLVCESSSLQHLAYVTNTPSLTINAREPFGAYPVRPNGLFALCTPIDLETAQRITFADMLSEPYFRDLRKQEARGRRRGSYGYFDNTAEEVIQALREMMAGAAAGWANETEGQARFRARVVDAGAALAAVSPHVAEWGPDEGFIGDGRLIAFQAERVS